MAGSFACFFQKLVDPERDGLAGNDNLGGSEGNASRSNLERSSLGMIGSNYRTGLKRQYFADGEIQMSQLQFQIERDILETGEDLRRVHSLRVEPLTFQREKILGDLVERGNHAGIRLI